MPSRSRRARRQDRRPLRLIPVPSAPAAPAASASPAATAGPATRTPSSRSPAGRGAPAARTRGALALGPAPYAPPAGTPAGQPLREVAQLMAQLLADVLTGSRPALHLAGRVSPPVYEELATQLARRRVIASARRPIVWRTHVCVPAAGVAEVSAVAHDAARAYPIAFRLERARGRWRCVAVTAPLSRAPS